MKFVFMNDKQRYEHILRHYNDLVKEFEEFNNESDGSKRETLWKKCIYMDLFQIGEHFNKLSEDVRQQVGKKDVRGIIDTRNKIGHAYFDVDPVVIEDTIKIECPRLIAKLKELFE